MDLPKTDPDAWTFVVLPDTQMYAKEHPDTFEAQLRWIADERDARRIRFVLHEGDITDNNSDAQWKVARDAFDAIEGRVPYTLVPGNHDYGRAGSADSRETLLHEYFPPDEAKRSSSLRGLYEQTRLDNSYHVFDTPDGPWMVLALEFGPRDPVVSWARDVLTAHPDTPTILLTHAYVYSDENGKDARYDRTKGVKQIWTPYDYGLATLEGSVNDGQQLFEKLVQPFPQIVFVFCGHVLHDGVGRITDTRDDGTVVHQMLANFQMNPGGGEGYLRVVTMRPAGKVSIYTYSPYVGATKDDADHRFDLAIRPTRK